MNANAINIPKNSGPLDRHRLKNGSLTKSHHPEIFLHEHSNPTKGKPISKTRRMAIENKDSDQISSLWVNKVGDRIVGMARLVQDGPHSARIVVFHIDPEWFHTKVALHLIDSIQAFCQEHGGINLVMPQHAIPPWMQTMMNSHGVQCV
jgi:hypothetical protein